MLTKANNEMAVWRHKCESGEGGVRSEEMEELKRKMNAKVMELEAALEAAQTKASSMEKVKNRLQGELDDLTIEVERVREIVLYCNIIIITIVSFIPIAKSTVCLIPIYVKIFHSATRIQWRHQDLRTGRACSRA